MFYIHIVSLMNVKATVTLLDNDFGVYPSLEAIIALIFVKEGIP